MGLDFWTFQYSSQAKVLIHHGGRTDRKDQIDLYPYDVIKVNKAAARCILGSFGGVSAIVVD